MSIAETARRIFMERGWKGFFVGLGIGYIKMVRVSSVWQLAESTS
jgi:solute carrier family 25 protein 16